MPVIKNPQNINEIYGPYKKYIKSGCKNKLPCKL